MMQMFSFSDSLLFLPKTRVFIANTKILSLIWKKQEVDMIWWRVVYN